MGAFLSQCYLIPQAPITERNCPDQTDRVFIVTGGYAGIGFEVSQILYAHNAAVYIAGRSESKASEAIAQIERTDTTSSGRLEFMQLDLSNLATIKPAIRAFLAKEQRLDVLINNAGVMVPPKGSQDAQGNELQIGTNCLGHCLLYRLLEPLLAKTAATSPSGTVRVAWAGSIGVDVVSPKPGGMKLNSDGQPQDAGAQANYGQSKVGNVFLGHQYARRTPENGIIHASFNPGNLRSELQRNTSWIEYKILDLFILYPTIHGAYTELWATLAPEVTPDRSGSYVWPWGRFGSYRADIQAALKQPADGGTGGAASFVSWCEKQTQPYL